MLLSHAQVPPGEANEVPGNWRLKPWTPSLGAMFTEGRLTCLVLSLELHVVSELKFSYLTNANPTDNQIWAWDLVHPYCIFSHFILSPGTRGSVQHWSFIISSCLGKAKQSVIMYYMSMSQLLSIPFLAWILRGKKCL